MEASLTRLPSLCQGCGEQGVHALGNRERPAWCKCTKGSGPFVAPPRHVSVFRFLSAEERALKDEARPIMREWYEARDALASRWVEQDGEWTELPKTSPVRRARAAVPAGAAGAR